jgi:hypothetical protein
MLSVAMVSVIMLNVVAPTGSNVLNFFLSVNYGFS